MANTDLPAISSPGSRRLKNSKHERYCRLRATMLPRAQAWREAGWNDRSDDSAYSNACTFEHRPGVKARIEYLSHQDEQLIREKRRRIEEALWSMHEADIGDCFETYEAAKVGRDGKIETDEDGKMLTVRKQRPKLLSDLPADVRKTIERVQADAKGNFVPQLYSRPQVNAELRKMLKIGFQEGRPESDVSRLSDAELIQQLAEQAKALGVDINLNYDFVAKPAPAPTDEVGPVIDDDSKAVETEPGAADSGANAGNERDAQAAREFAIGMTPALPASSQRRSAEAGARKLHKAARNAKR
jgi:hypothetical protein